MTHADPLDRADRQSYEIVKIQGPDSHTILGHTYDISYENILRPIPRTLKICRLKTKSYDHVPVYLRH